MSTGFQEFLRKRAWQAGVQERNRKRDEWNEAAGRLIDQIKGWLESSDPEDLLEVVPYKLQRMEPQLGIYDSPALMIRLGMSRVDVMPVGRYAIGRYSDQTLKSLLGIEGADGPAAGRVDITNGGRKYLLFREISTGADRWYAVDDRSKATVLDQAHLETILQDLWS